MAFETDHARSFWKAVRRLTLALLLLWLLVNLAVPWFARDMHAIRALGFPLGFWLAAQGALLLYLAIVVVYALVMNRLELRYQHATAAADDASGNGSGSRKGSNGPVSTRSSASPGNDVR